MSSPAVARLLQIQQELTELQTLSKPTPDALQRLQVLANELQALQTGPAPCAPPPPCAPAPPPPVPPVFAGSTFFPMYGAEPRGCGLPCGGCGECEQCYNPCAPAACGNPLPLSVFQGPNGCAPAYTIQGPPGLVGPPGPTGPPGPFKTFVFNADNTTIQTINGAQNKFTFTGTFLRLFHNSVGPAPPTSNILSTTFSAPGGPSSFSGNVAEGGGYFTSYISSLGFFTINVPTTTINQVVVNVSNAIYFILTADPAPAWQFQVYYF